MEEGRRCTAALQVLMGPMNHAVYQVDSFPGDLVRTCISIEALLLCASSWNYFSQDNGTWMYL